MDDKRTSSAASLDIVIPVFNELQVLPQLLDRLNESFGDRARSESGLRSVSYIFVDDGSTDRGAHFIAESIAAGLGARLIRLSRNFGHQSAVSAGMDHSSADLVAIIDADLQDPPELILEMIEKWRSGADVVVAQRAKRKEGPVRRFGFWLFYRMVNSLADVPVPLDGGDFCLMTAQVRAQLRSLPEKLRFPRGLRAWVGFKQETIEYDRPRRQAGVTKYSIRALYHLATDGIASLSTKPLRIAQFLSVGFALGSIGIAVGIVREMLSGSADASDSGLLALALMVSTLASAQMAYLYVLGAYVGRTYLEVKGRPTYLVAEIVEPANGATTDAEAASPSEAP